MKYLFFILLALGLHLFLGWQWVIFAAIVAGYSTNNAFISMGIVLFTWFGLICWNYFSATAEMERLFTVMEGVLGNISWFAYPIATLIFGANLGFLGGKIGTSIKKLF